MSMQSEMENVSVSRTKTEDELPSQSSNGSKHKKKKTVDTEQENKDLIQDANKSEEPSSAEEMEQQDDEKLLGKNKDNQNSVAKTAKNVGAAATVTSVAAKGVATAKLLMWLQMMMQMLSALWGAMTAAIASAVSGIVSAIVGFVSTIATAIGVSAVAVATTVVGVGLAGVVTVVVTVTSFVTGTNAIRDDSIQDDCSAKVELAASGGEDANNDEQTLANAKLVYSVLSTYGLADENIAGVIGNWVHESGIDPTGVETIYDEKFQIGSKKQHAMSVDFNIDLIDAEYASRHQNIDRCGIGLGQWTNSRNQLLLNYATAAGYDWYSLDVQLAFCLAPTEQGGDSMSHFFKTWAPAANAEVAAKTFNTSWEGIAYDSVRGQSAATWFVYLSEWKVDADYANSIIEMAGNVQANATDGAVSSALDNCNSARTVDNSSLASAAVEYAWETEEMSHNNGTELYQKVHDGVYPGDTYYQSCDRSVGSAVRWSGTDDSYPAGPVSSQLYYMQASPKWLEITDWGGDKDKLQPGDILIRYDGSVSHTVLYVGNEAIRKKYSNADISYCIVSGSLNSRSPGCGVWWSNDSDGLNTYRVFRNVQKETDSQYTSIGLN